MRSYIAVMAAAVLGMLALSAYAQPPEGDRDRDRPPERIRERVLRAFDNDANGGLSDEERDTLSEQLGERADELRERLQRRRREADADRGRRPIRDQASEARRDRDVRRGRAERGEARGDRSSEARQRDGDRPRLRRPGQEARRGPRGDRPQRNLQALFAWFDMDGDSMLSRGEFNELSQFVERRRPGRPGGLPFGPPDGPRLGRRGEGPPPGEFMRMMRRRDRIEGAPARQRPNRPEPDARPDDDQPRARDTDERRRPEERRRRAIERWRADQPDADEPRSERNRRPRPSRPDNLPERPQIPVSQQSPDDKPIDSV